MLMQSKKHDNLILPSDGSLSCRFMVRFEFLVVKCTAYKWGKLGCIRCSYTVPFNNKYKVQERPPILYLEQILTSACIKLLASVLAICWIFSPYARVFLFLPASKYNLLLYWSKIIDFHDENFIISSFQGVSSTWYTCRLFPLWTF